MNEIAEYAVNVLNEYAYKSNFGMPRSTSDISPLEEWLIIKLYQVTDGKGYKTKEEGPEEWEIMWKKTFESAVDETIVEPPELFD